MPPLSNFQKSLLTLAISSAVTTPANAAVITLGVNCDSLSNAVVSANTDTAVMDAGNEVCIAGAGDDTIVLQNSALTYSSFVTGGYGDTALPDIDSTITIQGDPAGASSISRDPSAAPFRLFAVAQDGELTLSSLTLQNGLSDQGGAVYLYYSSLRLHAATITGSSATASGGAVDGADSTVILENQSSLTLNQSAVGGAINLVRSSLTIANSTVANNSSTGSYGGVSSSDLYALSISNSVFSNNTAEIQSGALGAISDGTPVQISITDSTFSGNQALGNGGDGFGGGVFLYSLISDISNTDFTDNYARNGGGALYVKGYDSELTITGGTIKDNSASVTVNAGMPEGKGGAICLANSETLLDQTSVIGNVASQGGGLITSYGGDVTIRRSTFYVNAATLDGGALHHSAAQLTIETSTLSGNNVAGTGGALVHSGGSAAITNSTIYDNAGASSVVADIAPAFTNTVVGGSSGTDCAFVAGLSLDLANNWFQDASCTGTALGSPRLNELQDNNAGLTGLTLTHAPALASPLLGAGDAMVCLAPEFNTDQRGAARPNCDIGAVEGGIEGPFDRETCFVSKTTSGKVVTFCL